MRRRRAAKRSPNLITAVLIEVATLVGIVAIAQPTWTRNLIEQLPAVQVPSQEQTSDDYSELARSSLAPQRLAQVDVYDGATSPDRARDYPVVLPPFQGHY